MRKIVILVFVGLLMIGCKKTKTNSKVPTALGSDTPAERKMEKPDGPISELSIYNLPSKWTDQDGEEMELKDLRGNVLVMVMIYTTCKAACPRLVADIRHIEEQVPKEYKDRLKMVFVSIDPEVDTPEKMKAFSIENQMTDDHWLFLRGSEENTREFAAVLAVNYKRISPIDFSHSNIISVFNSEGELSFQQEGLGANYDETVSKIIEEAKKI